MEWKVNCKVQMLLILVSLCSPGTNPHPIHSIGNGKALREGYFQLKERLRFGEITVLGVHIYYMLLVWSPGKMAFKHLFQSPLLKCVSPGERGWPFPQWSSPGVGKTSKSQPETD